MATEDDLRDMFAAADAPHSIDATRVIAKSRARRLPRQLAIGAAGTLAIAGIIVVSLPALLPQQTATSTRSGATAPASAPNVQSLDGAAKRAPADKLNICGGALAGPTASAYGLLLDVEFPATAPAGAAEVQGSVRITNTGTETVTGTTAGSPAITVSRDGLVQWHSNGPTIQIATVVDLAPGQSLQYSASFTPVRCDVQDDEAESFRTDLPSLPPGEYSLSAAIDFLPDASMSQQQVPGLDLVSGPIAPITLQ